MQVLGYLVGVGSLPTSMREISEATGISMRVTKNVLLQLETLKQVERVTMKNQVLPKWKVSPLGIQVYEEASGVSRKTPPAQFRSKELFDGIEIPNIASKLIGGIPLLHQKVLKHLDGLILDLSKDFGIVLNIGDPRLADNLGEILKQVKYCRQLMGNLPPNPLMPFMLKKYGEKTPKLPKDEEHKVYAEVFFFDSLIVNQASIISGINEEFGNGLLSRDESSINTHIQSLQKETRQLLHFIRMRGTIAVNSHNLSDLNLDSLLANDLSPTLYKGIIQSPLDVDKSEVLRSLILNSLSISINGDSSSSTELKPDFIPLLTLYQQLQNAHPELQFSIEQIEEIINSLAGKYIPGVRIFKGNDGTQLKVIQLASRDLLAEEKEVLSNALQLQKFSLIDIMTKMNWPESKIVKVLQELTKRGMLRHSSSYLHGEMWYVVSSQETN